MKKNDAKQNSKLARLSETKQKQVRLWQFCFHEPLTTILNKMKLVGIEPFSHVIHVQQTCQNGSLPICFVLFRMVESETATVSLGLAKFRLVSPAKSFVSHLFCLGLFCIFYVSFRLKTLGAP
jgi:hypothetical protein